MLDASEILYAACTDLLMMEFFFLETCRG